MVYSLNTQPKCNFTSVSPSPSTASASLLPPLSMPNLATTRRRLPNPIDIDNNCQSHQLPTAQLPVLIGSRAVQPGLSQCHPYKLIHPRWALEIGANTSTGTVSLQKSTSGCVSMSFWNNLSQYKFV